MPNAFVDFLLGWAVTSNAVNARRAARNTALAAERATWSEARKVGKLSFPQRGERRWPPVSSEARMLSLDGEWFTCRIVANAPAGPLRFDQAVQPVVGGHPAQKAV